MGTGAVDLLSIARDAWSFTGLTPRAVLEINAFGNLLLEDIDGRYWRICPEELSCEIVAESQHEFERLRRSDAFCTDWDMDPVVTVAAGLLGRPGPDRCFCLKVPAALGGPYEGSNFETISLAELIACSGDLALQIRDLPDGSRIQLKVIE